MSRGKIALAVLAVLFSFAAIAFPASAKVVTLQTPVDGVLEDVSTYCKLANPIYNYDYNAYFKYDMTQFDDVVSVTSVQFWMYPEYKNYNWDGDAVAYLIENQTWVEELSAESLEAMTTSYETSYSGFCPTADTWDYIDVTPMFNYTWNHSHENFTIKIRDGDINGACAQNVTMAGSWLFYIGASYSDNTWVGGYTTEEDGSKADYRAYLRVEYEATNSAPTLGELVEPTDPSTYLYGQTFMFNATVCDADLDEDIANVTLDWNGANETVTTYSVLNDTCREYYSVRSGVVPDTYSYVWYANDTAGEDAPSQSGDWTLDKATLSATVSCSPSSTVNYGTETTCDFSESNDGDDDVTYDLYRDDIDVGTSETATLAAGTYDYKLNTTAGPFTNYTVNSSIDTLTLTVNQVPVNITLYLNGSRADTWYLNNTAANLSVYANVSGASIGLTTNATNWASDQTGTTNITYIYTTNCSDGETINVTGYLVDTTNYTASNESCLIKCDMSVPNMTGFSDLYSGSVVYTGASQQHTFYVNVTDNLSGVSIVYIEWGGSNFSASQSGDQFSWTTTGLAAASYTYRWWANDTVGNANYSETQSYVITAEEGGGSGGGGGGSTEDYEYIIGDGYCQEIFGENWQVSPDDCFQLKPLTVINESNATLSFNNQPKISLAESKVAQAELGLIVFSVFGIAGFTMYRRNKKPTRKHVKA